MNLNLFFSIWKCQILQRDEIDNADLHGYFEPEKPAYLYCILSKNRISINHESIRFNDNYIKPEFIIHNKGEFIKEQLEFVHDYKDLKEVKVVSEYPYNEFSIVDKFSSCLIKGKAAYFPEHKEAYNQVKNKELLDYEILYIGQSVLSQNNVPVLDRTTTSHKTFQKILEEYNKSHPDKELFLIFISFKQDVTIDIPENVTDKEREFFLVNFQKNYFHPTIKEERQNVSILESVLINYFKPKYNDKFVNNPPNKSHTSFSGINDMNINRVNVLFGIEDFFPRLYTNTVGRKSEYNIEYMIK